jgi:wyosine [tRNA(Phe)-imidazoG37] synthetase (radical SAM superfamily)
MEADVVLPSLDAATTEGFALVNRPHPHLRIGSIVRGLQEFRREYRGAIWLEVFLARGMNDSDEELEALRMVLREIAPDKIQLNTVVRPPAEQMAQRVEMHRLLQIKAFLGSSCEIIVPHSGGVPPRQRRIDATAVVGMVARRPMTLEEIASGTGISRREVRNMLDRLEATDTVSSFVFDGKQYFRAGHTPV